MVDGDASLPQSGALNLKTVMAQDKRTVSLQFLIDGAIAWVAEANTPSVDALIRALDASRAEMLDHVSFDVEEGKIYPSLFDPGWAIRPDPQNRFAVLWIRNPGVGWYAYGIPRHEAIEIVKWLRKIPRMLTSEEKRASLPPYASSFGNDEFLVTTSGLGFYYYGKGERRIGPDPFEQIEFDSDRAAGIVAGSITERRLEDALRSIMKQDQPTIAQNLFRPSGALGPFSTKIDLAYLLHMLSSDAYKDITNLKNIRNDFAHDLNMDAFDVPSIRDRCKNFILVDRHIGPVPSPLAEPDATRATPYSGLPNYKEKLADARFRYIMTAQILNFKLGMGADDANRTLPLI